MCYVHHWKGILNSFCSLYYIKVHGKNGEGITRFFLGFFKNFCVISFPYMTFIAIVYSWTYFTYYLNKLVDNNKTLIKLFHIFLYYFPNIFGLFSYYSFFSLLFFFLYIEIT